MSTLYLTQQGSVLNKDHERFRVRYSQRTNQASSRSSRVPHLSTIEIPIREVEQILIFGNVQLSTAAMAVCFAQQIPTLFLSQVGRYKGHLWSSERRDLPTESAQFGRRPDRFFQLEMARSMVYGKVTNARLTLLRLNRKRRVDPVSTRIKRLTQHLTLIEQATTISELRGYEGSAARFYFESLGQLITNPEFCFTHRNRRPPRDPVNSLLSFGYTLLFNNVMSLILAEGLNPYLGNLHRSDRKEPHLAFDLMEEFRAPVVDSLVMAVVNQKVFQLDDFTIPNEQGGVYLEDAPRRRFLKHFEERISSETYVKAMNKTVSLRRAIQFQIQQYKRCLKESVAYTPFTRAV